MASLRDLRSRIKGVENTQKITKAMKMVAAAKLRRAQENIINARPYARKIRELMQDLITDEDKQSNPFIIARPVKTVAVVIVTADRGLCGGFNSNIIREASAAITRIQEEEKANVVLFCIGKKGYEFFKKQKYEIFGQEVGVFSTLTYDVCLSISKSLIPAYVAGTVDKIMVIYNEFKSIVQQRVAAEQYLPVPLSDDAAHDSALPDFIFEPTQQQIVEELLPIYLRAQLWRILLESNAAELGAKMTAMDAATTNASEIIRTLRIKYNKARQAAITNEILEVVSGANALKANG